MDVQTVWGQGRNERKEKGECYPRTSSPMDDPREELVKGNGNFCRGARYLEDCKKDAPKGVRDTWQQRLGERHTLNGCKNG
ncbi:hypothetical protein TNCV_35571 [Trichonephila clavipes]|nr:hypothetical protein TNCV_35571 [Trichonephila clavipes]